MAEEEETSDEEETNEEDVVVDVDQVARSIDQVLLDQPSDSTTEQQEETPSIAQPASTSAPVTSKIESGSAVLPDEDDESDGGEWITPSNVNQHRSYDLGLLPTENAHAESGPIAAACMTGDFAVQNVLLGMGLGLVGEGGKRISKVKSFVLRCHACFK